MTQIEASVQNRVARVRMNAPPSNILTSTLQNEIRAAFEQLRNLDDHNVVAIESAIEGKFSTGADIAEHQGEQNCRRMLAAAHALIAEVLRCPVPTICVVNGLCLGGAFELALACDQIVCTKEASFGLPEITLGCYPPAALVLMPQRLPPLIAYELIQSGRVYPAHELNARGAGFSTECNLAHFADLPRGPLVETTRLLRAGAAERFRSMVGPIETAYFERLLTLSDAEEGPKAFLAKRKPAWNHSSYR